MHIHINGRSIHREIDEIRNMFTSGQQIIESMHHGRMEIRVTHESSIHEKELMCSFFSGCLRFSHISRNRNQRCFCFQGQQFCIDFLAIDIQNALTQGCTWQMINLCTVIEERKRNVGINQNNLFEIRNDIAELRLIGLHEFPSCWYIEEKIFDRKIASNRTRHWFL